MFHETNGILAEIQEMDKENEMSPTIEEFLNTIEVMRGVYPFKNETARIARDVNPRTREPGIVICTYDEETETEICLTRRVEVKHGDDSTR